MKHRIPMSFVICIVSTVFLCSVLLEECAEAFPGKDKVRHTEVLEKASRDESQDVMVVFDENEADDYAESMRAFSGATHDMPFIVKEKSRMFRNKKQEALNALTTDDADTIEDYSHLPMMFLRVKSRKALEKLAAQPGVAGVYLNQPYSLMLNESLPLIGQPAVAASGFIGSGTAVAVLDSGVDYTRSAFGACTVGSVPDCTSLTSAPPGCSVACVREFALNDGLRDDHGHGTNVSGIVAGVAPGTRIIGLDVLRGPAAFFSDIAGAINWVIASKSVYNIVAINLSLGIEGQKFTSPCPTTVFGLEVAINNARAAGLLVAVAAGNEGYTNGISYPACVPSAVSVGALRDGGPFTPPDSADSIASFSNSSSFLTVLAPGSVITAAGISMRGTSQATPHIAGAAAVLSSAFPSETVDQIVGRMTSTGTPVTDKRNGVTKPRIDIESALSNTFTITGRVLSQKGLPVEGISMTLSGAGSAVTSTDASGNYRFSDIADGSYTITPAKGTVVFLPSDNSVNVSGASAKGGDFSARVFLISGKVLTASGIPVPGVTVSLSGAEDYTTFTDNAGRYVFPALGNGVYTFTPSKAGYAFLPASKTITLDRRSRTGRNFTAVTHAISGFVRTPSGAPVAGVTVTLSGDMAKTKVTDQFGHYRFANLPDGNYTVTPVKGIMTFSPASISVPVSGAHVNKQNFIRNR